MAKSSLFSFEKDGLQELKKEISLVAEHEKGRRRAVNTRASLSNVTAKIGEEHELGRRPNDQWI